MSAIRDKRLHLQSCVWNGSRWGGRTHRCRPTARARVLASSERQRILRLISSASRQRAAAERSSVRPLGDYRVYGREECVCLRRRFYAVTFGAGATSSCRYNSVRHPSTNPEEPMNKLKLRLEDLCIDSFSTTTVRREKGTVYGEQCTCYTQCTCPGCPTCDASCGGTCPAPCGSGGTCDFSCGGTCDYTCGGGGTCDVTCEGWATFAGPNQPCNLCGGGGGTVPQ